MPLNLYILLFTFLSSFLFAQEINEDLKPYRLLFQPKKKAKLVRNLDKYYFVQDSLATIRLRQLSDNDLFEQEYDKFKADNEQQPLSVYELLIYFGTDRSKANQVINNLVEFEKPYEKSVIVYEQPNYRVKLGRYYSKLEAYARLKELAEHYSDLSLIKSTYIVNWEEFEAR